MKYIFYASGHENIIATHKKTVEFTKDTRLTKEGDCIVAVKAGFEASELKKFLKAETIKITIRTRKSMETIKAHPNPDFSDDKEMVIRMSGFNSERTFAVNADKAAYHLSRKLVEELKNPKAVAQVLIECDDQS